MPDVFYPTALLDSMRGIISFESDEFAVMLLGAGFEPSLGQARRSDVAGYEVAGDGYKPGGLKAEVSIDIDGDAVVVKLGAARWPASSLKAIYAGYYRKNGGDPQDDEMIAVIDFKGEVISTRGLFSVAESILELAVPSI